MKISSKAKNLFSSTMSQNISNTFIKNQQSKCFSTFESDNSLFNNMSQHGFLPKFKPMAQLPREFQEVEELLNKMTYL